MNLSFGDGLPVMVILRMVTDGLLLGLLHYSDRQLATTETSYHQLLN